MKKERKRGLFEQKNECTGLLFRCSISSFPMMDGKRRYFQSSIRMSFLKRKSCGGCEHCGWMLDFMSEQFYNDLAMNPESITTDGYTPLS